MFIPIINKRDDVGDVGTARFFAAQRTADHLCHKDGRHGRTREEHGLRHGQINALGENIDIHQDLYIAAAEGFEVFFIVLGADRCTGAHILDGRNDVRCFNARLVEQLCKRNRMINVDGKDNGLPVFVRLLHIGIDNQLVAGATLRDTLGQFGRKCVEMLDAFQRFKPQIFAILLICIVCLKMGMRKYLSIDEFLEVDFVGDTNIIFLRLFTRHTIFVDARQEPLLVIGRTERRRREADQFDMRYLVLNVINDAPICLCRGVMRFVHDEENLVRPRKPRGKSR